MGTTHFAGPIKTGTIANLDNNGAANQGLVTLTQQVTLTQNSTAAVSATISVPQNSQLIDILVDPVAQWNSGASATLTVGTAAAGTQYASAVDVKAATGRIRPTFSIAQLTAMNNVTTNRSVVVTVTPSGATSAGQTTVTLIYAQTER